MSGSSLKISFRFRTKNGFYPGSSYVAVEGDDFVERLTNSYNFAVEQAEKKEDPIEYVFGLNLQSGNLATPCGVKGMFDTFKEYDVDSSFISVEIIDKEVYEGLKSGKIKKEPELFWGKVDHAQP